MFGDRCPVYLNHLETESGSVVRDRFFDCLSSGTLRLPALEL